MGINGKSMGNQWNQWGQTRLILLLSIVSDLINSLRKIFISFGASIAIQSQVRVLVGHQL